MPATTHYWQPDPRENRTLLQTAEEERRARATQYVRALDYYEGRHPPPLRSPRHRTDPNVVINLVAQHVDHTVAFAFDDFPRFALDPVDIRTPNGGRDRTKNRLIQQAIRHFWQAQGGASWLGQLMVSGVLTGHAFVRVVAPDATTHRPPAEQWPRALVLNPANVTCYWQSDHVNQLLWYEVQYQQGREKRRQDILAPGLDGNERWQIREYALRGNVAELLTTVDWPHSLPPIIEWQHLPRPSSYYGRDELQHLPLNDAVNRAASNLQKILHIHASPRFVGFGFRANDLQDTSVDAMWTIDNPEARVELIEMQGDLGSSLEFIHLLSEAYLQQAQVTVLRGGPDAFRGVTNLGIRAAFMSQLSKTTSIHRQYGHGLAQVTRLALEMCGLVISEPQVQWSTALPVSESELTEMLAQQVAAGFRTADDAAKALGLQEGDEEH